MDPRTDDVIRSALLLASLEVPFGLWRGGETLMRGLLRFARRFEVERLESSDI